MLRITIGYPTASKIDVRLLCQDSYRDDERNPCESEAGDTMQPDRYRRPPLIWTLLFLVTPLTAAFVGCNAAARTVTETKRMKLFQFIAIFAFIVAQSGCEQGQEQALPETPINLNKLLRGVEVLTSRDVELLKRVAESDSSDEQARLWLGRLQEINTEQATILSHFTDLSMDRLTVISVEQAQALRKVQKLSLNGLTQISPEVLEHLVRVEELSLNGLTSISDEQALILGQTSRLSLNGVESLSDEQFATLHQNQNFITLRGLLRLTDAQADSLSKFWPRMLLLNELKFINDEQAALLGQIEDLYLDGISKVTDGQMKSFSNVNLLSVNGLSSLTDSQAQSLQEIRILELEGVEQITDAQAKILVKNKTSLSLGLTTLTDKQAAILSQGPVLLRLRRLKEISFVQAKWLSSLNESNLVVPHEIKIKIWNAKNKSPSDF